MTKSKIKVDTENIKIEIPKNIREVGYFRKLPYTLTDEQWKFIEAIWNKKNIAVFCNAKAGSSKTTLAVGMAMLMTEQFKMYNKVYYVVSPCEEDKLGFSPGTIEDKTAMYMESLKQALVTWGYDPSICIESSYNMNAVKEGKAIIKAIPHTFLRGNDLSNCFIILDEAQNYKFFDLKKALTRSHDDCKVIVIGHTGQVDLKYPQDSGFKRYLEEASSQDFCETVSLTQNFRGKFSNWSDKVTIE